MGPIGSGLPQFGFPRLFAMKNCPFHLSGDELLTHLCIYDSPDRLQDAA
jgi:hypothetical protein